MRVLTLSDLFPWPTRPLFGLFVERQVRHLRPHCEQVVVVPVRLFPPLRIWKAWREPGALRAEWGAWRRELHGTPEQDVVAGVPVYYPRYTSPPKQGFHGIWGYFAYPFVRSLLRRLHHEEPFDLIHAHYASPAGALALLASRWMRVPVVLSVHGMDIHYTATQNRLSGAVVRRVFQGVDAICANSQRTARRIVELGGPRDRVHVVRLGGDLPRGSVDPLRRAPQGALSLLSVGHLYPSKGHATVLRALHSLLAEGHALHLVIVGDGPERAPLEALAQELGIGDAVSFEGAKRHDAIWPYYAACDLFVLPSRVEGFGLVYAEALSMGKPAIGCTGAGGPEDLRELGDCIELVPPDDPVALATTLRTLCADPARRAAMGERGQAIIQRYYTWERNAEQTMELYQKVVEARCA